MRAPVAAAPRIAAGWMLQWAGHFMRQYRIYTVGTHGQFSGVQVIKCAHDQEALQKAQRRSSSRSSASNRPDWRARRSSDRFEAPLTASPVEPPATSKVQPSLPRRRLFSRGGPLSPLRVARLSVGAPHGDLPQAQGIGGSDLPIGRVAPHPLEAAAGGTGIVPLIAPDAVD